VLTADTGADEPKLHVSRKSITETREWGREKNKSLVIKYLSNYHTLTNQQHIFLPALRNIASDLANKTGLCFLIGVLGIHREHESHVAGLCPRKSIQFKTHIIPQAYVSRTNAKIHVHYLI